MYDVLVIGGGQAGLSAGYYLSQEKLNYLIVEGNKAIGDNWRKRWEGLTLFTPNRYNRLPDSTFPGECYALPDRLEVATYFEQYAKDKELQVITDAVVDSLTLKQDSAGFSVSLKKGTTLEATHVILACGAYRTPAFPGFADAVFGRLPAIHTNELTDPLTWLDKDGCRVLVIGAGASGSQVASLLAKKHSVVVAGHDTGHLPRRVLGRDVYDYLVGLGILTLRVDSFLGKRLGKHPSKGEIRVGKSLAAIAQGAPFELKPKVTSFENGCFVFEDGSTLKHVDAVVFATGYSNTYPFLTIPAALDKHGSPAQLLGKSPVDGLYWLGLPQMRRISSALLVGADADAKDIVDLILASGSFHQWSSQK